MNPWVVLVSVKRVGSTLHIRKSVKTELFTKLIRSDEKIPRNMSETSDERNWPEMFGYLE